jgi:excisionase family DNA binding protein
MTQAKHSPNEAALGPVLPPEFAGRTTLTVEEARNILGMSRSAAYAAVGDRSLPTVKIGGRYFVPRIALERLLIGAPQS